MIVEVTENLAVWRVAVRSPLPQLFDYLPPLGEDSESPQPGTRVLIPFGRRKLIGLVVETAQESFLPTHQLKHAFAVLETCPSLSAHLMRLATWCSDYYHFPLGEVLQTMLPGHLRHAKPPGAKQVAWRLTELGRNSLTVKMRSQKQQGCLAWLGEQRALVTTQQVQEQGFSSAILRILLVKGLVEKDCVQRQDDIGEMPPLVDVVTSQPHTLNDAQAKAVAAITGANGYETFLLDGVTGSGKTLVYLHAIEQCLAQQGQVLVLVPEIGLTPQTITRFQAHLRVPIGVWHSHMTDAERYRTWQQAKSGKLQVVIGTRSAVFCDMPKLAMIIIDEAHDPSFKQQSSLRYLANDVARVRAHDFGIPVVLGSATPPLSLLIAGKYPIHRLRLKERAGVALKPAWSLIDLRGLPVKSGLSEPLLAKMASHLAAGHQVLVFLNQRGYSPALICHQCGEAATCQRCDAKMTLHEHPKRLLCHHCGAHQRDHHRCQSCGSVDLFAAGVGTGRLEQALRQHFPKVSLLRIDRDSVRKKGTLDKMLSDIHSNQYKLLVGTQMLAKGHDFPNLTMVAVVNMDDAFFSADFHAIERLGALMVQVAGRAGRADKPGEVVVQTHQPQHPLLQLLVQNGYHAFAEALLQERKALGLPPYGYMALIRASSPNPDYPLQVLQALVKQTPNTTGVKCVGPLASPMARRAGQYRVQLLIWTDVRKQRHQYLLNARAFLQRLPLAKKVRWSIDVDPIDMQ